MPEDRAMTRSSLARLFLLAAGAGIPASEFKDCMEAIYASNPQELLSLYNQIRRKLRQIEVTGFADQLSLGFKTGAPMRIIRHDVIELARRANLTSVEATDRIHNFLVHSLPTTDVVALPIFNQKEGFGRWVEKVARAVGPSILLNAATSALAPEDDNDPGKWKLSGR
jgi:hypothetical protein